MPKVYLSSTFKDLRLHRQAVSAGIAKAGYQVIRMEDYPARAMHTKAACQNDVSECQAYVGIFAWRYGYIPLDDNPEAKSITELEYDAAHPQKRLVFLLKEDADWPADMRDDDLTRVQALRAKAKTKIAAYFEAPPQLALEVVASLHQHAFTTAMEEIKGVTTFDLGPSYIANLQEQVASLKSASFVNIHVGRIPWWSTRLHLVASMLTDFTGVKELIFCNDEKNFIAMASPKDVARRLGQWMPGLEDTYVKFRQRVGAVPSSQRMINALNDYPSIVSGCFGNKPEKNIKEDIEPDLLRKGLSLIQDGTSVRIDHPPQPPSQLQRQIVGCSTPYVILECGGTCDRVIDRVALLERLANVVVEQRP